MSNSLVTARAELLTLLCADTSNYTPVDVLKQLGVVAVYPSEPVTPAKPLSVTAWVSGMDPDFFTYEIRVYRAGDADAVRIGVEFDAVIDAIDMLIGSTGRFGPSTWQMGTNEERDGLLAINRLTRGREYV